MKFIKITTINGESYINLGLVQSIEFKTGYLSGGGSGETATMTMADGESLLTSEPSQISLLKESVGI